VVIRASSAAEVTRLLADLASGNPVRRESAIARLTLVGDRAVDRLLPLLSSRTPDETRIAALAALEAMGHPRGLSAALALTSDPSPALVAAAIGVARVHLTSRDAENTSAALDCLAAIALDPGRREADRALALDALHDLPRHDLEPILARLRDDPSAAIRQRVTGSSGAAGRPEPGPLSVLAAATLSHDPAEARTQVQAAAPNAAISDLHRLIGVVRERERAERTSARRQEWCVVRATVHQVLAARGSRIGLYDLRETLEAAGAPVAVGFLAAAGAVGDATCLEPLAAAYSRAQSGRHESWRRQISLAFREIVRREKITRRHAILKRVINRWPDAARQLLDEI
jgi:hypothetical protein